MRRALAYLASAATLSALGCSAAASARVTLAPTFDIRQVYDHGNQGDDSVTYSEALIGVDGSVNTRRIKASLSYQYGRRFEEKGTIDRSQRQQLFARAETELIDRRLTVSTGAFAALLNRDYRGQVSFTPDAVNSNLVQTYSVFVEPRYTQPINDYLQFDLDYRLGYYDVHDPEASRTNIGGATGVPGGSPGDVPFDAVSDSVNQYVRASLGNRPKSKNFHWDVSASATTEDIHRLDQRYRSYQALAEAEYVVVRGVGLIADVGYQRTRNSEQDYVRDSLGNPVADADGNFQLSPGARRSIFAQNGLTFEGGVRLQPSRRSFITIRAGRRFGEFTVNGEARYQVSPRFVLTGRLVEGVDTFGQLLTRDLGDTVVRSIVSGGALNLGGCIFGVDPGTGTCLFNATQSITNATFRNRSAQGIAEYRRRHTSISAALIYSDRTFLDRASLQSPTTTVIGVGESPGSDKTLSANLQISQTIRRNQTLGLGLFANRYDYALSMQRHDTYLGLSASYDWRVGGNLSANANFITSKRISDLASSTTSETASLGVRLRF